MLSTHDPHGIHHSLLTADRMILLAKKKKKSARDKDGGKLKSVILEMI